MCGLGGFGYRLRGMELVHCITVGLVDCCLFFVRLVIVHSFGFV